MKNQPDNLTDRERILLTIVRELAALQLHLQSLAGGECFNRPGCGDRTYVHFDHGRDPKPGDLVMAQSTRTPNAWVVSWYVSGGENGNHVVREIGTGRLCNYGNESFIPIIGMEPSTLLEGEEFKFRVKVLRAFGRGAEYMYRFGGLDFKDGNEAVIWIREVFGGINQDSEPFSVTMKWTPRTSIKAILETLRAGGYGTRKFGRTESKR